MVPSVPEAGWKVFDSLLAIKCEQFDRDCSRKNDCSMDGYHPRNGNHFRDGDSPRYGNSSMDRDSLKDDYHPKDG